MTAAGGGRWTRGAAALGVSVLVLGASACSGSRPAAAPAAVRGALAQVDAAMAAHDYAAARDALDALVRSTLAAKAEGQLSAAQADRVLAAATKLQVDLPQPVVTPVPSVVTPDPAPAHGDKGKGKGKGHED